MTLLKIFIYLLVVFELTNFKYCGLVSSIIGSEVNIGSYRDFYVINL